MNYKDTLFLPETEFSMKASLPSNEPKILQRWKKEKLYEKLRNKSKKNKKFILHDGPPYANGHLHMGHALNKILKDIIVLCLSDDDTGDSCNNNDGKAIISPSDTGGVALLIVP